MKTVAVAGFLRALKKIFSSTVFWVSTSVFLNLFPGLRCFRFRGMGVNGNYRKNGNYERTKRGDILGLRSCLGNFSGGMMGLWRAALEDGPCFVSC